MTNKQRRWTRIACKCTLLVCLPTAGFFWAFSDNREMFLYAIGLAIVGFLAAVAAETLATYTEDGVERLEHGLRVHTASRAEEMTRKDRHIYEMETIIGIMERENHDLRAKLINAVVRKHHHDGEDGKHS